MYVRFGGIRNTKTWSKSRFMYMKCDKKVDEFSSDRGTKKQECFCGGLWFGDERKYPTCAGQDVWHMLGCLHLSPWFFKGVAIPCHPKAKGCPF